jgi:4-alpha-glucanotransferase
MPAYDWERIAANGYDYPVAKVQYAEKFFDFFRIDHVVGVFRLWTIDVNEPLENEGQNGRFDPADEAVWEEHGKKILRAWLEHTRMLPCAEDLGTVPQCSYRVLEEFGIPGIDVQRWVKDWANTRDFKDPSEYRKNSIAVLSTHDSASFVGWWEFEAGTVDEMLFRRMCGNCGTDFEKVKDVLFDPEKSRHGRLRWNDSVTDVPHLLSVLGRSESEAWRLVDMYKGSFNEKQKFWEYAGLRGPFEEKCSWRLLERALSRILAAASVFSVQLIQDWLSMSRSFREDPWYFRINFPGTMDERNWSIVIPMSLEELNRVRLNDKILQMNKKAERV